MSELGWNRVESFHYSEWALAIWYAPLGMQPDPSPLKCHTFPHSDLMHCCDGGGPGVSQTKPRDCADIYRSPGVGRISAFPALFFFC